VAQRVEHFAVTVAALTQLPGQTTALSFDEGIVTGFVIRIPAGHAGKTGLQLWYAGVQVIPFKKDKYIRGNKITLSYETENYPTGAGWVANAFNLDRHPHTFRCDVLIDEFDAAAGEALAPLVLIPPVGGTLAGLTVAGL